MTEPASGTKWPTLDATSGKVPVHLLDVGTAASNATTDFATAAQGATADAAEPKASLDTDVAALAKDPTSALGKAQSAAYAAKSYTRADSAHFFGHSYVAGSFAGGYGRQAETLAPTAADLLGLPLRNEAVGGSLLRDNLRSWAPLMQAIAQLNTGSGFNGPRFTPPSGCRVLMHGLNDLGTDGVAALSGAFTSVLYAAVARMRAMAIFEDTDPSVTFGGAWATFSAGGGDRYSGASCRYTPTNGNTVTITTQADFPGGTVDVGFVSWTDGGATITTTFGGGYSINTAAVYNAVTFTASVLTIPNVPAGTNTITFTVSGVVGGVGAIFDYWSVRSPANQGPIVALVHQPKALDWTAYTLQTVTDAQIDTLNGILDTCASSFNDGRVITVDTSAINHDATCFVAGNVHPTPKGHRVIGQAIAAAVQNAVRLQPTPRRDAPRVEWGAAPPSNSQGAIYYIGDTVYNIAPAQGSPLGWICTAQGQPGIWIPFGATGTTAVVGTGTTFPPATGTWAPGNVVLNTNAAPNQYLGWICTAAGTPGTWKPIGARIIEGSGQVTLVAGTATVTGLGAVTSNTQIRLTFLTSSGTPGAPFISGRSAGNGFTITSTSATDTSIIGWEIVNY